MRLLQGWCIWLLTLAALALAKSSSGDSVLVILEPSLKKDDYFLFFKSLKDRGYDLTFRAPKDEEPRIEKDEIPQFSNVIVFAPETKGFADDLSQQSIVWLMEHGVNFMIALGPKATSMTALAAEFSMVLPPPGTPLISHFPQRDAPPTVIPVEVPSSHPLLSANIAPVWFSGIPHALGNNPLLEPILRAPPESFAADTTEDSGTDALSDAAEKGGEGLWAGSNMGLVSGFQTRDGARVLWAGGVDMFSDAFAKKDIKKGVKSGNQQLARDISAWTFQESLVLRIDSTTHNHAGANSTTPPPEHYTTNDMIVYKARVSKYDPKADAWQPYSGIDDMQLEFTMLDPHVRTALKPVKGAPGLYSVTFRAPDRHGVFKFVINYKRKGWTHLHSSTTVPVVPPRHDGYPRFLSAAWPYYAGAISTSVGFLLFSALWLAGDDRSASRRGKNLKTE